MFKADANENSLFIVSLLLKQCNFFKNQGSFLREKTPWHFFGKRVARGIPAVPYRQSRKVSFPGQILLPRDYVH